MKRIDDLELREYPLGSNYIVSLDGRIFSKHYKGKELTPKINWDGYHRIQIYNEEGVKMVSWHRVIARTWIPNLENKPFINHIDGDKTNNHADNLEWVTQKENINHAWDTGLSTSYTHSKYTDILHFDEHHNLVGEYLTISTAAEELNMNYFTILSNIKRKNIMRNGHYFRLHENCNDYSERK